MVPATTSLTGFSGKTIWPLGKLRLLVIIGDAAHSTKAWVNFMVVKSLSPYYGIIERPGLKAIQAVPSTVHGMLKFPVERGIVTICSTILIPTECASVITSPVIPREEKARPSNFKKKNLDIFAWQPNDITGVPRSIAEHRLNIRGGYSPVRHKKRGQAPEHTKAIQAEVQKLVEARIMREVYYHDWLSNPVMKVECLYGYPFKCFLDAYKGYHQIQLAEADEEKTAFHTGHGVYCYMKISFGLKNAGATYQRLMDKAFEAVPAVETQEEPLTLFTDGSSCVDGSGAGLILTSLKGVEFTYALRFQFTASNNEAEYEALVAGLRIAARMGVKNVQVSIDSKLVANQVLGTYVAKEDNMIKYLEIVKGLVSRFTTFSISQVPRSKNKKADAFSKITSTSFSHISKQWGIDIAGPFPEGPGKVKFLIVAMDYFTKWIEAKAVATITGGQIEMPTYRTAAVDVVNNDDELRLNLDLLEEHRERAVICEAKAKSKMMKYYNARVHGVAFKPGDFIYRSNDASHAVAGGKLGPK
nr:reverse transcriptase domain-containing protein [Tanacetum cinerariifolium]